MTKPPAILLLLLTLAAAAPGCADLTDIPRGTCGNGVIDAGEDCDTFSPSGLTCGAPGKAGACRFTCDAATSKTPACPTGSGCGTDKLCRAPKDTFTTSDQITETGGRSLEVADFDGDGRQDLLSLGEPDLTALSSARVVYFDTEAKVAQQNLLPSLVRSASGRDLDGDGVADLVASVDLFRGIEVFRGSRDRTFSTLSYPSFNLPKGSRMRVYSADVLSGDKYPGDEIMLFGTYTFGGMTLTAIHTNEDDPSSLLNVNGVDALQAIALLPAPIEQIAAAGTATIRVCKGGDATCGCPWTYWTYAGSNELNLLQLCRKKNSGELDFNRVSKIDKTPIVPIVKVALPTPVTRVFVTDANGDGLPDVIASTKGTAYIAYGDGKGAFFGTPMLTLPGQVESLDIPDPLSGASQDPNGEILAVGNLDRDAVADFVTPHGIFLRKSNGTCPGNPADKSCTGFCDTEVCAMVANLGGLWSEAVIGDFNGNKAADVLVGSGTSTGLTFYNGSGVGLFTQANLPTDAPVRHFMSGDFDGDYVEDVALTEIGNHDPSLGETGDKVSIMFGRPSVPDRPVEVGRFNNIVQLERALLPNGFQFDLATDLGVVNTSEDGAESSIAILFGSADRRPLAPLSLRKVTPNPKDSLDQGAVKAVIADLDGDGIQDVAALGATLPNQDSMPGEQGFRDPRLWTISNAGGTALTVNDFGPGLPFNPVALGFAALAVGGDLDGDGRAEIVVAGTKGNAIQKTEIAISGTSVDSPKLAVKSTGTLARYAALGRAMRLIDVDVDGQLDLVLLTREVANEAGLSLPPNELTVVWGTAGGFDYASPTIVPFAKGGVYAVAARRTISGMFMVVFADSGTYFPRRTGRAIELGEPVFAGGEGGAVADVNGDGIDDIAVLSGGSLRIHVGQAVLP